MKRMEKVGMGVDVSHCADQTTLDALDAAEKPTLFTHATCRALIPGHMRAKTDEAIRKMAKTGGVMGIAFIRFMVRNQEPVNTAHVLDHFDYVRKLVGVEYLAVGSDLDVVGNGNPMGGGFGLRASRTSIDTTITWKSRSMWGRTGWTMRSGCSISRTA